MGNNRRHSERINIPLEIVLESESGKRDCRISDLSLGGCFVDSIANVIDGEVLGIVLHLPTGQCLKLSGEVVYIYPGFGFGLRFLNPTREEHEQLQKVILTHGGNPTPQKQQSENIENKPKVAGCATEQKKIILRTEDKSYNEFEEFLQDLLGNFEGESKPLQTSKNLKAVPFYT